MSKLIIAEKPSVAQSIAAVLGATQRKDGYLEGNGYIVSWCVGHLVQLAPPDAYAESFAKWRREDLPIIPEHWQYVIPEGTKKQFDILKNLMDDARVYSLVAATDAGREGELIFRLVYNICECRKPVERLWISSLEESAIRKGFQELRPGSDFNMLFHAALTRSVADWLVGMNGTRLLSTAYNQTLSVGRVMTPTLALVVAREEAILSFRPTSFYTVELDCGGFRASSEKYSHEAEADSIAGQCHGRSCVVQRVERQEKRENPPRLYDLTTLQREANRFFGFTAQQTLDYVQNLYEKKLCTYPRTDSQYLPEVMMQSVAAVLDAATAMLPFGEQLPLIHDMAQVVNDKKVTDHHAIIPTGSIRAFPLESLPSGEYTLLMFILARLLCAVGAPHEYAETRLLLSCANIEFSAKGKQVLKEGWRTVQRLFHPDEIPDDAHKQAVPLPEVREGDVLTQVAASVKEGKTTPPKHFTEDSLLSAMERAVDTDAPEDADGQAASVHKGLGTPATRAATIEKLVHSGYMERKGGKKAKHLIPTQKGVSLITVAPESIKSPRLTAEWEEKLKQIEHGELPAATFLDEITTMLQVLVRDYTCVEDAGALFPSGNQVIGPCVRCNGNIIEKPQGFFCENAACGFSIWKNNYFFAAQKKQVTAAFVSTLLKDGRVLMKGLTSQKTGKPYDAYLVLDPASEKNARFKIEFIRKGEKHA